MGVIAFPFPRVEHHQRTRPDGQPTVIVITNTAPTNSLEDDLRKTNGQSVWMLSRPWKSPVEELLSSFCFCYATPHPTIPPTITWWLVGLASTFKMQAISSYCVSTAYTVRLWAPMSLLVLCLTASRGKAGWHGSTAG